MTTGVFLNSEQRTWGIQLVKGITCVQTNEIRKCFKEVIENRLRKVIEELGS